MVARSFGGIPLLRKYRRLLSALEVLREHKLITEKEMFARRRLADFLYDRWKEDLKKIKTPGRLRGRPKEIDRSVLKKCKRHGCENAPAPNQAYCRIECSPYGLFNLNEDRRK